MPTHLERLLFTQGGLCFFCRQQLPKSEASVEHLLASANGGGNADDNCVACCKTLNHLLGSKSIKEKMLIVLNQRGSFKCPGNVGIKPPQPQGSQPRDVPATDQTESLQTSALKPSGTQIDMVLADLKKRGTSRPRKTTTLNSTIKALFKQQQKQLSDDELATLVMELQRRGKIIISDTKVSYKLG